MGEEDTVDGLHLETSFGFYYRSVPGIPTLQ